MAHEVSGTAPTLPDLCRLKIGISIPCRRLLHPSLVPTMLFVLADQVEQRRFLQISIAIISDETRNCAALGGRTRGRLVRPRSGVAAACHHLSPRDFDPASGCRQRSPQLGRTPVSPRAREGVPCPHQCARYAGLKANVFGYHRHQATLRPFAALLSRLRLIDMYASGVQ